MPVSDLVTLLSMIGILVGIRIVLFLRFPPVEIPSLPVETTTTRATEETLEPVPVWPVVVLVVVIAGLVVGLMAFGNAIGG